MNCSQLHSLSLCRWLGLHAGGLAGSVVVVVVVVVVFLCVCVCVCDRCLKEEVGMTEVGYGSWFSQVRCCWVLLVVEDCQCLGSVLLGCSDW